MRLEECNAGDTDKGSTAHNYLPFYERHLVPAEIRTLTEIGVWQGGSLRMWQRWIPHARVIGIDIEPDNYVHPSEWSLPKPEFVAGDATTIEPWPTDVLVDDGSHRGPEIVDAFWLWWPMVTPGGWYVIEDLAVLYGQHFEPHDARTLVEETLVRWAFQGQVAELHAYEQILFVRKRP